MWILLLTPVGAWILHRFAILPEEAYLERKFDDAYLAYKRRVRRWLWPATEVPDLSRPQKCRDWVRRISGQCSRGRSASTREQLNRSVVRWLKILRIVWTSKFWLLVLRRCTGPREYRKVISQPAGIFRPD